MPHTSVPRKPKKKHKSLDHFMTLIKTLLPDITFLHSGCNRSLKMSFEDQLNILVRALINSERRILDYIKVQNLEIRVNDREILPMAG